MNSKGRELNMHPETLAAKLIGRWKSGAPLARFPTGDPNIPEESEVNDFEYRINRIINKDGVKPLNLAVGIDTRLTDKEFEEESKKWNVVYGIRTPRFAHIR